MRRGYVQFRRYAAAGILMNSAGYLLFAGVTALGLSPKLAMTSIYVFGVLLNFWLSKKWVFRHDGIWSQTFLAYVLVYLAGYIVNYALILLFVDHLGWNYLVVQAICIGIVAGFIFAGLKLLVFRSSLRDSHVTLS
ncbi:MAG: GtrA family protein [Pseudomonadota bacterium]